MNAPCTDGVTRSNGRGGPNGDGNGNGDGDGNGNGNGEERGGGELWYPPHEEKARVEDLASLFRTRHHLWSKEVVPTARQQLRAQDRAPTRRCGTKRRTEH